MLQKLQQRTSSHVVEFTPEDYSPCCRTCSRGLVPMLQDLQQRASSHVAELAPEG